MDFPVLKTYCPNSQEHLERPSPTVILDIDLKYISRPHRKGIIYHSLPNEEACPSHCPSPTAGLKALLCCYYSLQLLPSSSSLSPTGCNLTSPTGMWPALFKGTGPAEYSLGPSLAGGHREQGEQSPDDIVIVELVPLPLPAFHLHLVLLVVHIVPSARLEGAVNLGFWVARVWEGGFEPWGQRGCVQGSPLLPQGEMGRIWITTMRKGESKTEERRKEQEHI